MCGRRSIVCAAALSWTSSSCGDAPRELAAARSAVVYGADDRREVYQQPAGLRELAASVVALVPADALERGTLAASEPSLGERYGLCASEPFVDQPAAALCTGVLIDWDLVLTAAHCLLASPLEQLRVVFNYAYLAPGELAFTREDVFSVAEVVVSEHARVDYAVLRLSETLSPPRRPARLAPESPPLAIDERLTIVASASGAPLKIDRGAHVRERADEIIRVDSDTTLGSSGAPAFSEAGELVGVLARGHADFYESDELCLRSVTLTDGSADEEYTSVAYAKRAMCTREEHASALCSPACEHGCTIPPPDPATGCQTQSTRPDAWLPLLSLLLVVGIRRRATRAAAQLTARRSCASVASASP
jgi:MYXO-CTERM domain-containing protein